MITELLQIDTAQFSGASPMSTAVYGILVAVLVAAILYLARKVDKKEVQYQELSNKTLVVITEVKEKILDQSETKTQLASIETKLTSLQHYIELNLNGKGK